MPRPKVKPQDRRRSIVACSSCKAAKIRCDSRSPCRACVKRGRHATCSYDGALRAHLRAEVLETLDSLSQDMSSPIEGASMSSSRRGHDERDPVESPSDLHSGAGSVGPGIRSMSSTTAQTNTPLTDRNNGDAAGVGAVGGGDAAAAAAAWEPNSRVTQSRMMLSSRGEKVYLGPISTLSLLHFLRQVLKHCIGPSPFTETDCSNVMLEEDLGQCPVNSIPRPLSLGLSDVHRYQYYVRVFCEATSGMLYLYTEDEVQFCLKEYESGDSPLPSADMNDPAVSMAGSDKVKRHRLAAAYLMIAIGGQCQGSSEAPAFFLKGQQIAFEGFLYDPSLDMLKEFLLMAYYTLAACRRNAAFMYLGVASKAAAALGLQRREQYRACSTQEAKARLRCWQSLRVLDTLVNSLLGRAGSTLSTRPDIDSIDVSALAIPRHGSHTSDDESDAGEELPRKIAIDASYEVCRIIDEVDAQLYKSNRVAIGPSEDSLQRLRQWGQQLPPELRRFSVNENRAPRDSIDRSFTTSLEHERVIGAVHVACSYYFAVILGTRPFLISHVMSQLQTHRVSTPSTIRTTNHHNQEQKRRQNPDAAKIRLLAQACVESSALMTQLCAKAVQNDLLYDNMCMIQGLIFAAGLLLGFSLLVQDNSKVETILSLEAEGGLQAACLVLQRFRRLSAEAQHDHRVLVNFSEAIKMYRQRLIATRRDTSSQFIDPVFVIDDGSTTTRAIGAHQPATEHGDLNDPNRARSNFIRGPEEIRAPPGFPTNMASNTTYLGDFFSASYGVNNDAGHAGGDVDVAFTNGILPAPLSWAGMHCDYPNLPPGLFFEDHQ